MLIALADGIQANLLLIQLLFLKILDRLTLFRSKLFVGNFHAGDTVYPEFTKALTRFTPCRDKPNGGDKDEAQGANATLRLLTRFVRIADLYQPLAADRSTQRCQINGDW